MSVQILLLYMFFFIDSDITNKKLAPGAFAQHLRTEKINECDRCKVLTDSFSYWLKETSRGKYEGGDTAWEEAKLKSYSRSEIRLVEVQEGLCSELSKHQHDCYMLAEEAEQVLEKWWFHEDTDTLNLQDWLCIETLKHCCPDNHFGESCAPCPLSKGDKICSGQGRCDGEGTRNGNGSCICNKGYVGVYCEDCAKNYYAFEGLCKQCDPACEGCSSSGRAACNSCRAGWEENSGLCTDIDECISPSICKSDQYCINKEGTYRCKKCDDSCKSCIGAGPSNCTSCEPIDSYLWKGKCIAESLRAEIIKSAVNRMTIYIGMLVILGVLYKAHRYIALIVFIIFAFYIYFSEKSQHVSIYDVYFNNFGRKEGAWFL